MIICHIPHQLHLIKKYVGKVTTSMKDEKRFFSKNGGHEIFTHSSQMFQSLWYIFYSVYGTIMGGKCFVFLCVCVCVCVCSALNRTKKLPVKQKEIPVCCTKSPILSWTVHTSKMQAARSSQSLTVTYKLTSSDLCPRSLVSSPIQW